MSRPKYSAYPVGIAARPTNDSLYTYNCTRNAETCSIEASINWCVKNEL